MCPDLPVVKCFYNNLEEKSICMEDLIDLGYVTIIQGFSDLKNDILTMDHIELVMQTLAKFHSTSVGINWLEKYPHLFLEDTLYGGNRGTLFKKSAKEVINLSILPIAKIYFKDNESCLKSVEWLASEDFLLKLTTLAKADPNEVNVLCHGDCAINNMMFKMDQKTGKPLDIKLIDFQICRYAHPSRDLLYFIYMCTTFEFRQKHEQEILQFYLANFNANLLKLSKDVSLTWDEFYAEYEKSRFFGLIMALFMRPRMFVKGIYPTGGAELTEDYMKNRERFRKGSQGAIEEFENNDAFKKEMINLLDEVDATYHKLFFH